MKLYVVLRGAAPGLVDGLLGAVGASRDAALDAAKVYIFGLDFGPAGLTDAKLYFPLDRAKLGRTVANLRDVPELHAATRDVVLQRCLRVDRSQLYFHAENPTAIARYLRGRDDAPAVALVRRHDAALRALPRGRLEPWILSFAFRDHRLLLDETNVYFHLHGADAPEPMGKERTKPLADTLRARARGWSVTNVRQEPNRLLLELRSPSGAVVLEVFAPKDEARYFARHGALAYAYRGTIDRASASVLGRVIEILHPETERLMGGA